MTLTNMSIARPPIAILAALAVVCALASATIAPSIGAYTSDKPVKSIEEGLLDEIELYVAKLPAPADLTVIVQPFTSDKAELGTGNKQGDKDEQTEAQRMQTEGPKLLADSLIATLKEEGGFRGAAMGGGTAGVLAGPDPLADTLIVEGQFTELDPGSRVKRYFVGFGAGKAAVAVTGTVKDASGKLLATFKQRRVATMGAAGGDSIKKMTGDCKSIGEDIAKFLSAWAKGKKLD